MFNPVSPLYAIVCTAIAMATSYLLLMRWGRPVTYERYASLDGLRGYLAFFVFLHHSSIWFYYTRSGLWVDPPSSLYTHFGQSGVAMFFMITGFLFFSKLIDGRSVEIDWGRLYVSRILRLTPLYMFAMFILFVVVAVVSNGVLSQSPLQLAKGAMQWVFFTVPGAPDLNGVLQTFSVVSGVTWSLPYEWLFYFFLPLLALTVGVKAPLSYLMLSIAAAMGLMMMWHPQIQHILSFVGGIAAAFFVRVESIRRIAALPVSSVVCFGFLVFTVATYQTRYSQLSLISLSVAFILIACGNTLFGLLTLPVSRLLGEISYSIYLMHGFVLFLTFYLLIGAETASTYSPLLHWVIVAGITPLLIIISFITYQLIELPSMKKTQSVVAWIRFLLRNFLKRSTAQR